MPERAPDHNPDIATDVHLNAAEQRLLNESPRRSADRHERGRLAAVSMAEAVRELQLWNRSLSADLSVIKARLAGVDGRLRRLEAASAADDMAIDDLRDAVEDLRAEVDLASGRSNTVRSNAGRPETGRPESGSV